MTYIPSRRFSIQPPSTSSVKTWRFSSGSPRGTISSCRFDVHFLLKVLPHLIILSWSCATTTSDQTKIRTPSSPFFLPSSLTRPSQLSKFSSERKSTWTRQVCVMFWRSGPTLPFNQRFLSQENSTDPWRCHLQGVHHQGISFLVWSDITLISCHHT